MKRQKETSDTENSKARGGGGWWNRRQVITHRGIQVKLASVFIVWFLAFLGVFGFIFAVNYGAFASRVEQLPIHDQLLTKMLLVEQSRDLLLWYGLAAVGYLALSWIYLIIYSHRLTGPIYKITKIMNEAAAKGEIAKPVKFRKSDAFEELAKAFTDYNQAIRDKARF